MANKISYNPVEIQKVRSTSDVKIYNALQKADGTIPEFDIKEGVSRFTDDLYGKGTPQDIIIRGYQYTANGKTQKVSMSQLFMTICMNRANDLELQTVEIMGEMSKNTTALSELADLEDIVLNGSNYTGKTYKVGEHTFQTLKEVQDYASNTYQIDITKSDATTALESKMDEYNTLSQDQMIELQSLVEKRNQAYTLVSNSLKSMYNSNSANASNMK